MSDERWRQGHKVPLNVYAESPEHPEGRPVTQCHDEDDARRIVEAVNAQAGMSSSARGVAWLFDNVHEPSEEASRNVRFEDDEEPERRDPEPEEREVERLREIIQNHDGPGHDTELTNLQAEVERLRRERDELDAQAAAAVDVQSHRRIRHARALAKARDAAVARAERAERERDEARASALLWKRVVEMVQDASDPDGCTRECAEQHTFVSPCQLAFEQTRLDQQPWTPDEEAK